MFLNLYQRLSKCLEKHPSALLVLQYSVASIHGFTVYVLSVILSIIQLIMITATIENLEWVQTYKPLMCEWDKSFPGFVFPALDIESDSEDDIHNVHKGKRYWATKTTLKAGDDDTDDGYHSEESQRRMKIKQSMNPTLRKRLIKYEHLVPSFWTADEGDIADELDETTDEQHWKDHHSTSKSELKPSRSKRVTFDEQVQVLGQRRSSQVAQVPPTNVRESSTSYEVGPNLSVANTELEHPQMADDLVNDSVADPSITKYDPTQSSLPDVGGSNVDILAREEAEYQRRMASEDGNGSGKSSPTLFRAEPRQSTSSAAASSSPPQSEVSSLSSSTPSSPNPEDIADDKHELKRAGSIPLKLHSLLHRHNNGQKESNRRSATFSGSSIMDSSSQSVQPRHSRQASSPDSSESPQEQKRTPLSLGTRARRSLSLALPRHGHGSHHSGSNAAPSETNDGDNLGIDHHGSIGRKNKNLAYRIVHPQRYKRELEQQLSEKDRQRLLTMVQLQRQHFLEPNEDTSTPVSHNLPPISSHDAALCGNAYYFATSAEYVEGLGAPGSVISTSVGTSFPEELQSKKSKGRSKPPRPLSLVPVNHTTPSYAKGNSPGLEGDSMTRSSQHPNHKSLFNWHPPSPHRLQNLLRHPGHKHTQSTSSLIYPPGAMSSAATPNESHCAIASAIKSPITSGAHRLLSIGRSDSEKFTSFTSLGTPFNPQALPKTPTTPNTLDCSTALQPTHDPATEHTTFASIGYWSPNQSPAHSAPGSPRQSVTIMPSDLASLSQVDSNGHEEQDDFYHDDQFYEQDSGDQYPSEYQQGSLKDQLQMDPSMQPTAFADASQEVAVEPAEAGVASGKPPRKGLGFMRKLSRKNKK